uniref:Isoflavone reductase homolog n=1 Tax=Solanum tuberosum TaxID=4113 RepID=M1D7P4_SOLTU
MAGKSKILFIGGTGYIGKLIVEASAKAGHDTFVLVTESTLSNPTKAKFIDTFKSFGVTFLYGDLYDHVSLVKAIKQVDVVISTVGHSLLADQLNIIAAIKEAGNVKRFFASEFGNDVDRVHTVEPAKTLFNTKIQIRRAVEAEGIPITYVVNFYCADYFLPNLAQPGHVVGPSAGPPKDKVIILGDGNAKGKLNSDLVQNFHMNMHVSINFFCIYLRTAVFNKGQDFATYTIKAVDDLKTLNKILYSSLHTI